jgi:hypothetical protein
MPSAARAHRTALPLQATVLPSTPRRGADSDVLQLRGRPPVDARSCLQQRFNSAAGTGAAPAKRPAQRVRTPQPLPLQATAPPSTLRGGVHSVRHAAAVRQAACRRTELLAALIQSCSRRRRRTCETPSAARAHPKAASTAGDGATMLAAAWRSLSHTCCSCAAGCL